MSKKLITRTIAEHHNLHFGKYKGISIGNIINQDPEYIKWIHNNLRHIRLNRRIVKLLKAALESKGGKREHN